MGPARISIPPLSKSRYSKGLQCLRMLHLDCYLPDEATPMGATEQTRLEMGTEVEKLARLLFPNGILVEGESFADQVAITRGLLKDKKTKYLFQPSFLFNNVRIRVDVLRRNRGNTWDLIEVKSVTKIAEEHLPDVAIQSYVARNAGLKIRRACLMHLNKEYIYQGGDYDLDELFVIQDITNDVEPLLAAIPQELSQMREVLGKRKPPDVPIGRYCMKPVACPYYDYCGEDAPEHPIWELYRCKQDLLDAFYKAGVNSITDIPDDCDFLSEKQQRMRDVITSGEPYFDPALLDELDRLAYPAHFIDFETFMPALPLYAGTTPYQTIPFQWSDHIMQADGTIDHQEFLYDGRDDPRQAFAETLLDAVGDRGSLVVYSPYEMTRINALAKEIPSLEEPLLALVPRIFDLLPIIRNNCYHPEFHGSFSIKYVLPALCPDLGYSDLNIQDGGLASASYAEMIDEETTPERREAIRKDLLAYCERDTLAMVRLVEALREIAE